MQKENEIRFRISNKEKEKILSILQNLDWNPTIREEIDLYFCSKELFNEGRTQASPYVVRIRKSRKGNTLAYKSFLGEKSWIEIESGIEDTNAVRKILENLGQVAYLEIAKERQRGRIGNIEINIDNIKNLGHFIELEILKEDEKKGKKELIKFATEKLSIPKASIIHEGYVQLMEQFIIKNKKRGYP